VFRAKRRPADLALPVLADQREVAWEVAEPNDAARALAKAFWPGALTMVLPRTARSRPWRLGQAEETIAVRVPNHAVCLALLERTGPLAVTSANVSGAPPLSDLGQIVNTFDEDIAVYLFVPETRPTWGEASTIVDLSRPAADLLREGAISREAIERVLTAAR
jgi:tRNA threonylcarbamoyl adenosine modification protein (Sua5/YciO/YrdC/YwlC family)